MSNSVKYLLFCLAITFVGKSVAQNTPYPYYVSDSLAFVDGNGQPLTKAFSGGFHCPQFSPCDVNGDGKKDIVVYDKIDGSVNTYINKGGVGEVKYELDNRFASYFPKMRAFAWMLMRDYDNDGYEDIFTVGPQSYIIYKNISYTVSGRPAFVEMPPIYYRNMSPSGSIIEYNAMSTPSIHLPGIYDIDGDGDLDIMSYSNLGGAIILYMNYQAEKNLPSDTMDLYLVDLCWGYFTDYDCNNYIINTCSKNSEWRLYGERHTNGSSITLFDADDDNDIDLLIGNEGCSHMTMLYNAKPSNMMQYDSFYMYDTNYVSAGNRAEVSIYPAAYFMDIDNDGKRDLVYAPNSTNWQYYIEEINQVRWFKNIGTDKAPQWSQQQPLFTNEIIDNGNHSSWASADWDGDGDFDLLAAVNVNAYTTRDTADQIYLYENIGSKSSPKFQLKSTDFGGFKSQRINSLTISVADMDNDGKMDLVCGNDKGEILFYRNTSFSSSTLTPSFQLANNAYPGFSIDVGGFSAPAVADINNDGLKDLVIGRSDSMLSYYRNNGSLSNPSFAIVTSKFGNIKAYDSIGYQYIYDDTFAIIGYFPVYEKATYSRPAIMDIDGNDTLELVVANSLGTLRMYQIDGSKPTSTFKQYDSFYYALGIQSQKLYNADMGNFVSACFTDLDNDSVPELIIPINRGGIHYLKPSFKHVNKVSINSPRHIQISAFPNPADKRLEFMLEYSAISSIEVLDLLGRPMTVTVQSDGTYTTLNTESYPSGFYILVIRMENNQTYTAKFQVVHN